MVKRLAKWCEEHAFIWPWEGKESVMHLWAIWVTFFGTLIVAIVNIYHPIDKFIEYWFYFLAGTVTFFPPIYSAIKALVTKTKWEPWFWFNWVIALVVGVLFTIPFALLFGYNF